MRMIWGNWDYQNIPSKIFAAVKDDCVNTTINIMCVHAY